MGTDELFLIAKQNERVDRAKLKSIIVDLWTKRGAELAGSKWTPSAVWKDDAQDHFAYALGPTTARGWLAIVESAEYSASVDAELGRRLAALTTLWVSWSFDHAAMYGQKRLSKARSKEPVDAVDGCSYERVRGREGWEVLVFRGARPLDYARFAPSEKTKSDPLPHDPIEELESELSSAIIALRVDDAIDIVRRLGAQLSDSSVSMVFDPEYPIEWKETADGVAAIGSAMADVRPLDAESWVRLLEVAAVRNDAKLARRAASSLAQCDAKARKRAVAAAKERFATRNNAAATKRFAKWLAG